MKVGAGEFIKTNSGEVIWGSEAFIDEVFVKLFMEMNMSMKIGLTMMHSRKLKT